jgi:hypothetical protein
VLVQIFFLKNRAFTIIPTMMTLHYVILVTLLESMQPIHVPNLLATFAIFALFATEMVPVARVVAITVVCPLGREIIIFSSLE